jgi:hypothetical protein
MLKDAQISWGLKHEKSQGADCGRDLPIQIKLLLTIPLLWVWCLFAYHASVALVWNWQLLTILATFTSMYGLLLNSLLAPKRINFVIVHGSYLDSGSACNRSNQQSTQFFHLCSWSGILDIVATRNDHIFLQIIFQPTTYN